MKTWLRIFGWVILVGVVLFALTTAGFSAWSILGRQEVERRLDELRRAGRATSLEELRQHASPEALRLSEELPQLVAVLARPEFRFRHLVDVYLDQLSTPTPEDRQLLHQLVEAPACEPLRRRILELAQSPTTLVLALPGADSHVLLQEPLPAIAAVRELLRFGMLWTTHAVLSGQQAEADELARAVLRLSRLQPPYLIGLLARVAVFRSAVGFINDLVQTDTLPPETVRHLEEDLLQLDLATAWPEAMAGEQVLARALLYELCGPAWNIYARPFLYRTILNQLDLHEELTLLADRGPLSANTVQELLTKSFTDNPHRRWSPWNTLLDGTLAAYAKCYEAYSRMCVLRSCAVILCRLYTKGIDAPPDPHSLGLPREVVNDPFTGQPLRIIRRPEGWFIYSVGPDGVDNGTPEANTDWGLSPPPPSRRQTLPTPASEKQADSSS